MRACFAQYHKAVVENRKGRWFQMAKRPHVKIATTVYLNRYFNEDWIKHKTVKCELDNGIIIIPDGITNISGLNEDQNSVLDEIKGFRLPSTLSLHSPDDLSKDFDIDKRTLRKCPNLYDENGFFIIDDVLIDYNGDDRNVVVPDGIVKLYWGCFCNAPHVETNIPIETISLPESLIEIGKSAFEHCTQLRSVLFRGEPQLTRIGLRAFAGCEQLNDFKIPNSVRAIGGGAFFISSDAGRPPIVRSKGDLLYVGTAAVEYIGKDDSVTVPEGTTIIAGGIFFRRRNIETITLPKSLKSIGDQTFFNCKRLQSINIGDCKELEYIGAHAFEECCRLNHIRINEAISYIGEDAFRLKGKDAYDVHLPAAFLEKQNDIDQYLNYLGIPDENGLLIRDAVLLEAYKRSNIIEIPEGVQVVAQNAIDHYDTENCVFYSLVYPDRNHASFSEQLKIVFPKTIRVIQSNELFYQDSVSFEVCEEYLEQKCLLNGTVVCGYLNKQLDLNLKDDIYMSLYLYETIGEEYLPMLLKDPERTIRFFMKCLDEDGQARQFNRAAEFIKSNSDVLPKALIKEFYEFCETRKKKKAVEILKSIDSDKQQEMEYKFPTDKDIIIDNAIKLYARCYRELKNKLPDPKTAIVIESPESLKDGCSLREEFYNKLRDYIAARIWGFRGTAKLYDSLKPDELYDAWVNRNVGVGSEGLAFTLGVTIAEYALCENSITGDLVYCRDDMEYVGDYSSKTRPALHIEPNINNWKVYSKTGYDWYDM